MEDKATPKISVNKLAEYLVSSTTKKKSIAKDQIEKPPTKINIYSTAKAQIINFITSDMADGGAAEEKSKELKSDKSGTEKQIQNRLLSAEAIDKFLAICPSIEIDQLTPSKGKLMKTEIKGVVVNLNPEVILKNSQNQIQGFIKLHFSKSSNFQKRTKETISALIQENIENTNGYKLNPQRCYLIDLGTKTISTAPKNRKKIINEVADDCEVYSLLYKAHINKING